MDKSVDNFSVVILKVTINDTRLYCNNNSYIEICSAPNNPVRFYQTNVLVKTYNNTILLLYHQYTGAIKN